MYGLNRIKHPARRSECEHFGYKMVLEKNCPWWNFTVSLRSRMGNPLQIIPLEMIFLFSVQKHCSENEELHCISGCGIYMRSESFEFKHIFSLTNSMWILHSPPPSSVPGDQSVTLAHHIWKLQKMFPFSLNIEIFAVMSGVSSSPDDLPVKSGSFALEIKDFTFICLGLLYRSESKNLYLILFWFIVLHILGRSAVHSAWS